MRSITAPLTSIAFLPLPPITTPTDTGDARYDSRTLRLPPSIPSSRQPMRTRPVYLGLGQGTGYPSNACYNGRGSTCCGSSRNLNDYPVYVQGGDILNADVYPQNDAHPMWWIGRKTDRLRYWSNYTKPAWDDMEMNNFNNSSSVSLSTAEMDAEFWMSIIHGGHGIRLVHPPVRPHVRRSLRLRS